MLAFTRTHWFSALLILGATAALLMIIGSLQLPAAEAQLQFGSDSDIAVVPIQLDRDSYGLAMVDKTAETIWIYEISARGTPQSRLRLLAARSWKYDRQLEDLNNAEPKPEQIKALLESVDGRRKESNRTAPNILELAEPNTNNIRQ
jgi:hypothetical protein